VIIYLIFVSPYIKDQMNMETISELIILSMMYMQCLLTEFIHDEYARYNVGWAFIGIWLAYFLIYIMVMLINTSKLLVKKYRMWRKLRNARKVTKMHSNNVLTHIKDINDKNYH